MHVAMPTGLISRSLTSAIVAHLLERLDATPVYNDPYSHFYLEQVFPDDLYEEMQQRMPAAGYYRPLSLEKHHNAHGVSTRDVLALTGPQIEALAPADRDFWRSVAGALASEGLRRAVFSKLSVDLARRFGISPLEVEDIVSYPRPSLFRDSEGYEIAPHPDGRAKIVTMQLYLPADESQLNLGTAIYKRRFKSVAGLYSWRERFEKVKQFSFAPNSGYAFAVSNSFGYKSWHGRERLPAGSGVRNSILNFFFARPDRSY